MAAGIQQKNVAVVKKADRTANYVQYLTAEPNRRKCRVRNSYGHVTTLLMAIPVAEFSAVQFFAVCSG